MCHKIIIAILPVAQILSQLLIFKGLKELILCSLILDPGFHLEILGSTYRIFFFLFLIPKFCEIVWTKRE